MDKTISTPEITVLMPVFNGEKYLKDAIDSILQQTFSNFEFLIINDGSTDNSVSIIESYNDSRIRLIHNEKNMGLIATLNIGIELAKGTYIARMDSDDISLPQRLEKELEVFNSNPFVDVVATQMILINADGFKTGMWSGDTDLTSSKQIKKRLPNQCCIAHPSVMAKTALFRQYFYKASQKGAEDWDLWLRMASEGKVFYKIDELLIKYRVHPTSATIIRNKKGRYINNWKVQIKYCLSKINKLRFNFFDCRVLGNAFLNLFNHGLTLVSPGMPVAISEICTTNIFKVINRYINLLSIKIPSSTNLFLFIPNLNSKKDGSNYLQLANALDKKETVIFITDSSADVESGHKIIDISAISGYPYLQKKVRKRVLKYLSRMASPAIIGYDSVFFYTLVNNPGIDKIKCVDIIEGKMNLKKKGNNLMYNFGIWSMPYAQCFTRRIVIDKEAFTEMRDLYEKLKINPELLNRIEYMSNFSNLQEMFKKL